MGTLEKGHSGEARARAFLESKNYEFMAANQRTRSGEVDLIMREGETVVFVEVKSRENENSYGSPQESVTPWKQRKVVKAALLFIKTHRLEKSYLRFDVVSLWPDGRVEHLENAFGNTAGYYTI